MSQAGALPGIPYGRFHPGAIPVDRVQLDGGALQVGDKGEVAPAVEDLSQAIDEPGAFDDPASSEAALDSSPRPLGGGCYDPFCPFALAWMAVVEKSPGRQISSNFA